MFALSRIRNSSGKEAAHGSRLLIWGCCQPIVGGMCVSVCVCVCVGCNSDRWKAVRCKDLEPSPPQHF